MKQTNNIIIAACIGFCAFVLGMGITLLAMQTALDTKVDLKRIDLATAAATHSDPSYDWDVDLPEEIGTISTNPNKPTTLAGYIHNGKIFIEFPARKSIDITTNRYILQKTTNRGLITVDFVDYDGAERQYSQLTPEEYHSIFGRTMWWKDYIRHQ